MVHEQMPVVLKGIYDAEGINAPIRLYAGPLAVGNQDNPLSGTGIIELQWLPHPKIQFVFEQPSDSRTWPILCKTHLQAIEANRKLGVKVNFVGPNESLQEMCARGEVVFDETPESEIKLKHVIFHLPNFCSVPGEYIRDEARTRDWSGRVAMEANGWQITLDRIKPPVQPRFQDPLFDNLESTGGYAITHVGRIDRSDNSEFSVKDLDKALKLLFYFFSFCRGAWCSPQLPVGFNAAAERIWERWIARPTDSWKNVDTWLNDFRGMRAALPGFFRRLDSELWEEPFRPAIFWYIEANASAGGVEGSIILIQAALELLEWTLLVKDRGVISENRFDKLPAADKLRLLASTCGIPLETSTALVEVTKMAQEYNWIDVPQVLTEIRNGLVHPKNRLRQSGLIAETPALKESWKLGLWFLELVILRLVDYEGIYSNRLNRRIESISWIQSNMRRTSTA